MFYCRLQGCYLLSVISDTFLRQQRMSESGVAVNVSMNSVSIARARTLLSLSSASCNFLPFLGLCSSSFSSYSCCLLAFLLCCFVAFLPATPTFLFIRPFRGPDWLTACAAGTSVQAPVGRLPGRAVEQRGLQGIRAAVRDDRRHTARRAQVSPCLSCSC